MKKIVALLTAVSIAATLIPLNASAHGNHGRQMRQTECENYSVCQIEGCEELHQSCNLEECLKAVCPDHDNSHEYEHIHGEHTHSNTQTKDVKHNNNHRRSKHH